MTGNKYNFLTEQSTTDCIQVGFSGLFLFFEPSDLLIVANVKSPNLETDLAM
jgi:hypothetical protein